MNEIPPRTFSTMNKFLSPNPPNPLTPMTNEDLTEWLTWLDNVVYVADTWGKWIERKCEQAKIMSHKRKGNIVRPDGTKVNLSNLEWQDFKTQVDQDMVHLRKTEILVLHRVEAWDAKAKPKEELVEAGNK